MIFEKEHTSERTTTGRAVEVWPVVAKIGNTVCAVWIKEITIMAPLYSHV